MTTSAHPPSKEDERFMSRALDLAAAQLGKTAPNPSVGCVIVRHGRIVGEGATGNGGRPHAEELALAAAGDAAKDACAYVTLEPCNARSTGALSCSQILIAAGIKRVVIACEDPHHLAAHGISRLGAAGVETLLGVMRTEAEHLNRGFFKLVATGRPWLAIDADAASYDAEFDLKRDESFEQALERLGKSVTRVFVRAGTPIAAQLKARQLVDEDNSGS
ncbi:MAG TPA: bifunctional diaminohydroxyphosphoribosylaminopyrimidine deaminase/5-amino-6-(5-phosphoribosylamino)uracil reductase RibD [Hyphomonadaceae bacterium]|jgi:diaminohydroxyphosphoribosylaminopyrimidine deaminase/5-amino-6-(5-phosphoribosylamino)uracil reductase|nr:bifunctional diaminohydroxyphosphoribosylaminopyrimidine deaminase/5-amino-6-(5-phosphoribosylamino)uracil reductase RibD [Hyphomonadaceae bacterium]